MAFPTTTRDGSYRHKRGSAYTAFQEVQETGEPLDPTPDSVHPVGLLSAGTYNREETTETEEDVSGTTHDVGTTTEAVLSLTIMQRDVVTLEAPKVFSGYARVYQELTQKKLGASGDKGQISVLNAAKFRKTFGYDLSDMYPKWELTVHPNTSGADIVIDLSAFEGIYEGVGNATIGEGEYEDIVEFTIV